MQKLGALEQVEDVPRCPGEDVEADRFTTCEQVEQHTTEQGVPREETVEAVRSISCERVQLQAVERMVGEQSEVVEVTETASQDRKLQCTGSRMPLRSQFLKGV